MQQGSTQAATIIQVSKNHGGPHTIIHQNGQHVVVGKLDSVLNQNASNETVALRTINSSDSQSLQTLYPTQYIEAATDQTVYATSGASGQMQYHEYTPIIYTPVTGAQTYYQTVGGQVIAGSGFNGTSGGGAGNAAHAQLVTHQGATYLVQSGCQLEDDTSTLTHTAKASPLTVQWLMDNYETAEGVSLPRSTLYFHYLQHCHEHKLEPMNPASFGKLIRSVFLGLRTRRLGTRGNSKYHYYGIRIKPSSHLNHYVEDASFAMRHYPNYHRQSMEAAAEWKTHATVGGGGGSITSQAKPSCLSGGMHHSTLNHLGSTSLHTNTHQSGLGIVTADGKVINSHLSGSVNSSHPVVGVAVSNTPSRHHHAQFLGEASSALPNLDEICRSAGLPIPGADEEESLEVPSSISSSKSKSGCVAGTEKSSAANRKGQSVEGLPTEDLVAFACLYAHSAGCMLDAVVNLDFAAIANVWKAFWRTDDVKQDSEFAQGLPKQRLYALTSNEAICQFVRLYDHTFYQSLAEVLIPNVLRPIPPTLTQAIRNFAKSLETWMRLALQGIDPSLVRIKISAVSALAQTLRRYTSLNHLAQAARAVLKNPSQITQMLTDLNRVDFNNVQEQASWVCQCSDATVSQLEQDFKSILQKQSSLEEWAQWLDTVVTSILLPLEGNSLAYTRAAHQLILKWSFYSSMVIRDLTLRSAASFGSFHLMRLLYDEYIFYLVEHKVAAHLGMTPVAVMGELGRTITRQHSSSRSHIDGGKRRDIRSSIYGAAGDVSTGPIRPDPIESATTDGNEQVRSDTEASKDAKSDDDTADNLRDVSIDIGDDEDDEEIDEYLDDDDEPGDSTGDENTMLRRAHASVQALCRVAALEERSTRDHEHDGDTSVDAEATEPCDLPLPLERTTDPASSTEKAVSKQLVVNGDQPSLDGKLTDSSPMKSPKLHVQTVKLPPLPEVYEGNDSPPPIVTYAIPTRKVVRVTTFDDANAVVSPSENHPRAVESAVSSNSSQSTQARNVTITVVSSSPAPSMQAIVGPTTKRARLS